MYFTNLFPWLKIPAKLTLTEVLPYSESFSLSQETKYLTFKHAALLARDLSSPENPIASMGSILVSEQDIGTIITKTELMHQGILIRNVDTRIQGISHIPSFGKDGIPLRNLLNRKLDFALAEAGFIQSERFFWKPKDFKDLDDKFKIKKGLVAKILVFPNINKALVLADYRTRYYAKQNVWEVISQILEQKGIDNWRNASEKDFGFLYGRSVEATYRIWKEAGYWENQAFKIMRVDTTTSIQDLLEGRSFSTKDYHCNLGRKIDPEDQPVIWVRQGKTLLTHVPSLLTECPNMENLKKYSPRTSLKATKESRLDPASRFYCTYDYLLPLLDAKVIDFPSSLPTDLTCPQITMGSTYLEIKSDSDFSKFFSSGHLAKAPDWTGLHFFVDKNQTEAISSFTTELRKILRAFKVNVNWITYEFETRASPGNKQYLQEYLQFILDQAKTVQPSDMVIWTINDHHNLFYNSLKMDLTIKRDIPTQQLLMKSIAEIESNTTLKSGYVNPLFTQLIAKMGGFPYLFQEGITIHDAIFVGVDRFVDSSKQKPSITAAVACFGEHGEYLGAGSTHFDASPTDNFQDLDVLLQEMFDFLNKSGTSFKKVILLRDGRNYSMQDEIDNVFQVLKKNELEGAFVTANKSSGLRIYKGDPTALTIENFPEQYINIKDYYDANSFLLSTTKPIQSKGVSLGVSRPVLYTVEKNTITDSFEIVKGGIARGITAFSRLNWISFKGTRLPAPLDFAHDLARFCLDHETRWSFSMKRPTFL